MKKIVFAICFCFLSVAHVFAQDVVTDLYDRFDVRYSYLNVPGFSEQQIDQVVNALFKDFHKTRYNPETRTFRLCLMDFFYMFSRAGIVENTDLASKFALGVLQNAVNADNVEIKLIKINPEYEGVDLTKFTKTYEYGQNGAFRFMSDYATELGKKYCHNGRFLFDSQKYTVTCNSRNVLTDADDQTKREVSLLFYGYPKQTRKYMTADGTVYEDWAWGI